jgi:hypothetical protein
MKNSILKALAAMLLLCPTVALALTQSSENYNINAGRITSGGTAASYGAGLSRAYISIGQGAFIPPSGTSSASYSGNTLVVSSVAAVHTGDINGDGVVDVADALLALKSSVHLVQLSSSEIFRGDLAPLVNNVAVGDGKIDIEDAILILRKAVGLSW